MAHAMQHRRYQTVSRQVMSSTDEPDFTRLDDSALLSAREQMRAELERLPPHSASHAALSARYDASLDELVERARRVWAKISQGA